MNDSSKALAALFSMSREAVVGVKNGTIVLMNPAAVAAMERDATGERASSLLPSHLLQTTSGSFMCSAVVAGKKAAVSASDLEDMRIFLFTFQRGEARPGDLHASLTPPIRMALTNVKLVTERLAAASEDLRDERLDYCNRVLEHSYYQLWRLLRNVTVSNSLETGGTPYFPNRADVAALCRDMTLICAAYAEKRGVSVTFEPWSDVIEAVVDEQLVKQMLLNVISNSLLHTPVGGTVAVAVAKRENSVIISVDDDGDGIPEELLPSVFCRWMQTKALTDTISGAGVGLSVARGIAELHGGALIIESRSEHGTAVRIMLPSNNEPTAVFRADADTYGRGGVDEVLTFLSTWLPTDEYGRGIDE